MAFALALRRLSALLTLLGASSALAQTTQAWLAGNVTNSLTGRSIAGAVVRVVPSDGQRESAATADSSGRYAFAGLTPGEYTILAGADTYQAQEYHRLVLPVAGQVTLDFRLRPLSDVWEAGRYDNFVLPGNGRILTFYGPDLDLSRRISIEGKREVEGNLEPSVSTVIRSTEIRELPLTGRDAYALLVLLPGVTSYGSTGRGLGLAANGQRPSSANYLLDGLENNNLLVTGPLGAVVPEFLSEYRVSTSNFSAEYGRTAGFLANAVSRSGTNQWHGTAFLQMKNEALNANGFQENANGIARAPLKEIRPGGVISGPLIPERMFVSGSLQVARFRSRQNPRDFALPTARFIATTDPASDAGRLLRAFPSVAVPQGEGNAAIVRIGPPTEVEQLFSLVRLDWTSRDGAHRAFARSSVSRNRQPELLYSPYPGFSSPFQQGAAGIGAGWVWQLRPDLTQELRVGRIGDSTRYDRPHPEVPQLATFERVARTRVTLPSSPTSLAFRNLTWSWEIAANWTYLAGKHRWKFGVGALRRDIHAELGVDRDGYYAFPSLSDFAAGHPSLLLIGYDRTAEYHPPPRPREYRYTQADFFVQDAFQILPRLSISYGLRWDYQGSPVNTGRNKDLLFELGAGDGIRERIALAEFTTQATGEQRVYSGIGTAWGPRFGISYDLFGTGGTLLRASYGVFYDRPFDNLWQTVSVNRQTAGVWFFDAPVPFLSSPYSVLERGEFTPSSQYHSPLIFQPKLRPATVQSTFAGVQHRITDDIFVEQNFLASRGRQLWTTDYINRLDSTASATTRFHPNSSYEDFYYRANQGTSDYAAATTTLRFRRAGLMGQVSYTWSHAIDNQSDPLTGVFEDYNKAGEALADEPQRFPAFTRQFDSAADRTNADFDQRHNFVFYALYEIPGPRSESHWGRVLSGWRISGLGSIRSGLPYSVSAIALPPSAPGSGAIFNQRADLLTPSSARISESVAKGVRLLNAAAFATPQPGIVGNSGRNAFYGPGVMSADLSLARRFALPGADESRWVTLRADVFNAFNHANLNNPNSSLGDPVFGVALYGRRERASGFPGLIPLTEAARQIQLFLQIDF